MSETAHWLNNLAMVLGWAVIASGLVFVFVGLAAWWQKARGQGFPRTRRPRRFM